MMLNNINSGVLFMILIIHWLADFVFQNRIIAQNKGSDFGYLLIHIFEYSFIWLLTIIFLISVCNLSIILLWFPIITFITHGIIDYFTSKITTKCWKEGKMHSFFVMIGYDQVLHYLQLYLTFSLLI